MHGAIRRTLIAHSSEQLPHNSCQIFNFPLFDFLFIRRGGRQSSRAAAERNQGGSMARRHRQLAEAAIGCREYQFDEPLSVRLKSIFAGLSVNSLFAFNAAKLIRIFSLPDPGMRASIYFQVGQLGGARSTRHRPVLHPRQ